MGPTAFTTAGGRTGATFGASRLGSEDGPVPGPAAEKPEFAVTRLSPRMGAMEGDNAAAVSLNATSSGSDGSPTGRSRFGRETR
jgi:hypothetical protein